MDAKSAYNLACFKTNLLLSKTLPFKSSKSYLIWLRLKFTLFQKTSTGGGPSFLWGVLTIFPISRGVESNSGILGGGLKLSLNI